MNKEFVITCNENNLDENKEFILNIQKAMLVTLFECGKIDMQQYEYAVELLENNFFKQ